MKFSSLFTSNFSVQLSPFRCGIVGGGLLAILVALNAAMPKIFDPIDANIELASSLSDRMSRLDLDNDVIFLGDSRTHQGMSPEIFEAEFARLGGGTLEAITLGRPGMQTPFFYYTLQNYLDRAERLPKVIVLNVSYYLLSRNEWMGRIYLRGFVPTRSQAVDAVASGLLNPISAANWYSCSRLALCKYRATLHNAVIPAAAGPGNGLAVALDRHRLLENTIYDDSYAGYAPRGESYIGEGMRSVGEVFEFGRANPVFLEYLVRFVDLAAENGIEVIVYEFPWPPNHNTQKDRALIRHYQTLIAAAVADRENVSFVEYDHFWPRQLFVDPLHVNNAGATRLSKAAAEWYLDHLK